MIFLKEVKKMGNRTGLNTAEKKVQDFIPETEIGNCLSCGEKDVLIIKSNVSLPICLKCKTFWEPPKHLTEEKSLNQ
jgi:hypothetical protein